MVAGLLLATVCLVVPPTSLMSLDEPALLARVVGISLAWPEVLILLVGVLAITQEFRYGTASLTFLVAPRRTRVLAAKGLGLTLASLPITVGTLVVSVIVSIPVIR